MLFVGDIFQLPPVVADQIEGLNFSEIYKSEYFFDAPAYKRLNPRFFEFTRSFRQKDDQGFIQLLDRVRVCDTDSELLDRINSRYSGTQVVAGEDFSVILCSVNKVANEINAEKLRQLNFTEVTFEAIIEGNFPESRFPCQKTLVLKKNAQVIFTKNDPEKRWFNGSLAIVSFITPDFIEVRLQNGEEHRILAETWENRRYKYENKKIVSECIGKFTQFPVKLAWAITIHKSQGLTLQNVVIDMGKGAFVNGQVYTALSRCREFEKISLRTPITPRDIITDPRIIRFYETEKVLSGVVFE
jgi:ATP-dependent exoDNAse (exonuclease V) alpha subunit